MGQDLVSMETKGNLKEVLGVGKKDEKERKEQDEEVLECSFGEI